MASSGVATLSTAQDLPAFLPRHLHGQDGRVSRESILVFVAMSGSMIPLQVLESDSIESVKLRIQTCKGFVVKNQRLVCGGRELARNNSLLRDYGVSDGNVLHLILRLSDLQAINVKTSSGKEFTFHVHRSRDVGFIKRHVAKEDSNLVDFDSHEIFYDGEKVEDQRLIDDISRDDNAVIHLLVRRSAKIRAKPVQRNFELSIVAPEEQEQRQQQQQEEEEEKEEEEEQEEEERDDSRSNGYWMEAVNVDGKMGLSFEMVGLIRMTCGGLDRGYPPFRSLEGTGGTYFMSDPLGSKYVTVFKPTDEEPMAVNNPLGLPLSEDGVGLKKGTRVGGGSVREVAAYVLDHSPDDGPDGFSGVPPTTMVRCRYGGFNRSTDRPEDPKTGSLQMFVENEGSCEEMGPGPFPTHEVHKISVLDIRLANTDRHAGNILVRRSVSGGISLVPIDHGYCLPECFEDCTFDWLYWPQSRRPFSAQTLRYIEKLDAEEDIELLRSCGWELPAPCARVLRISTMLLKKGAKKRLTPHAIGSLICRESAAKQSVVEEIIHEANDCVLTGSSESTFLECVNEIMDRWISAIVGKM